MDIVCLFLGQFRGNGNNYRGNQHFQQQQQHQPRFQQHHSPHFQQQQHHQHQPRFQQSPNWNRGGFTPRGRGGQQVRGLLNNKPLVVIAVLR
jgi:hypothetical protein